MCNDGGKYQVPMINIFLIRIVTTKLILFEKYLHCLLLINIGEIF